MNRACFPKEKHRNSQKWAKFMNFSFRPFLWFGLQGRLLINARGYIYIYIYIYVFLLDLRRGSLFTSPPLSGTSVWRPQSRYTMLHIECRIKFPQNQRCRAKIALHPPQILGSPRPSTPKSLKKVSREEFGTPDPGPPKKFQKQSEKSRKCSLLTFFLTFRTFFGTLWGVRGQGSRTPLGRLFLRLFGVSGFWVQLTSADGRGDPNPNQGVSPFSGPPCCTFLSFTAGRWPRGVSR